ncbi:MAG: hypothetical protein ACQEQS_09920 [Thermodesulfobacteriota bacterium]
MNKKLIFLFISGCTLILAAITLFATVSCDAVLDIYSKDSITLYILSFILLTSGSVCLAAGLIINRRNKKKPEKIDILIILSKYSGHVTPEEFSDETGLSPAQSKNRLQEMQKRGICRLQITKSGVHIFSFPEFSPEDTVIKQETF